VTLIAAKKLLLPGGRRVEAGEEVTVADFGTEAKAQRLLRVGFILGYDEDGAPIRESRDFAKATLLAPKRAAAPTSSPGRRPSQGEAEPTAEAAADGAVAPRRETVDFPGPGSSSSSSRSKKSGKRRRKKT